MNITDMTPKKYAAEQAKRVMRVNATGPAHQHRPPENTLSEKSRKTFGLKKQETYALPKLPGAAGAREYTVGTGTYTGEELRPYTGRDGSMRAYALPSRGME